eukprot:CAMPEP_0198125012 /NCGR_PEP_ID=MMETSP1442-20131203/41546_1 /TAXON_ID= /ORGANISM="Craspedostauros australis, Strain CCMP3328" /LENGTH=211 /DNA_ID=CAMNT_0043784539 /DNA_START=15 /DNA_END=653 /DNA_ORIENTATION=-
MAKIPVALYVPNLLGYARIILALLGLHLSTSSPDQAIMVWFVSGWLDFFDGKLARMLDQCSELGVLLDVFADNIMRTTVWVAAAASNPSRYGLIAACIITLEWITMLCTQLHAAQAGVHWKQQRDNDPWLIKAVFANGFKNPLGILVFYGLFCSGVFAYGEQKGTMFDDIIPFLPYWRYAAHIGRGISVMVELWLCKGYLSMVIEKDTRSD